MFKKYGLKALFIAVLFVSLIGLTACSEKETVKIAEITNSYAYSETGPFEYQGKVLGTVIKSYRINLYDDGTYNLVETSVTMLGNTNGGITVWEHFGTYEKGNTVDGFKELVLSDATRAIYTSYSTLGGYAFRHDSETVKDWSLVELGGGIKIQNKSEFLSHAKGRTVYIVLSSIGEETAQLSTTGA